MLVVSQDPRVQLRYEEMVASGQSHNMAEMLACRAFPGLRTDAEFLKGKCNGNEFEDQPGLGNFYAAEAARHGVNHVGKTYVSGLARYPGDPEAWISGRGDAERICRERGWGCEGSVNVATQEREARADVKLSPDLVDDEVNDIMAMDPGMRRSDVAEKVYQLRSGAIDPQADDISGLSMDDFPRMAE